MARTPGTGPQRIVVLGAGYAGVLAALRLAGKAGDRARVTLVDPRGVLVERIRLHQLAAGQDIAPVPLAHLLRDRPIHFALDRAAALDLDRGRVMLGAPGAEPLPFDWLVNATGSTFAAGVPGVEEHAHRLTGPDAALRLRAALEDVPEGATVTVCGGGLTGIELATELAAPHRRVRMLTGGPLGPGLSEQGRAHVAGVLARGGEVVEHAPVARIERGWIELADGSVLPSDVTVWAGGFTGANPLAREAGLAVDASGRMLVDASLRSRSHPNVFGAGDAALAPGLNGGVKLRMACATALPMAAHASDNVLAALDGREAKPMRHRYYVQCISLGRGDGLVQRVDALDAPLPKVHTGRPAARFKELICRSTLWSLALERRMPGALTYPKGPHAPYPSEEPTARSRKVPIA